MKKLLLFIFFFLPVVSLAQGFESMVTIPGLSGDPSAGGFSDYINALYRLSISIAALIAVVKIIGAGVKYMFSDIVTSKSAAIQDIRSSLLGLLVVIGAVLILSTVNEDLTNFAITLTETEVTAPPPPPTPVVPEDTQTCYGFMNNTIEINAFMGLTEEEKESCGSVVVGGTAEVVNELVCQVACARSCNVLNEGTYEDSECRYPVESLTEYAAAQLHLLANTSLACTGAYGSCTASFCNDAADESLNYWEESLSYTCRNNCTDQKGIYLYDYNEDADAEDYQICLFEEGELNVLRLQVDESILQDPSPDGGYRLTTETIDGKPARIINFQGSNGSAIGDSGEIWVDVDYGLSGIMPNLVFCTEITPNPCVISE